MGGRYPQRAWCHVDPHALPVDPGGLILSALTTPEELRAAEDAARRVFKTIGLRTTEPFASSVTARALIYPIDYTMLERDQLVALGRAAAAVGEATAYLAAYGDVEAGWHGTYDHRLVRLDDFESYKPEGDLVLEHLLYSPTGVWGVITSHGDFALAGGPLRFVDALRSDLPKDEAATAREFVHHWTEVGRSGGDIGWLSPLLRHMFGPDTAQRLLRVGE